MKEGRVLPCDFYFLEETSTTSTSITDGAAGFSNVRPEIKQSASSVQPKAFEHSTERMDEECLCNEKPNVVKYADGTQISNLELDLDEVECERDLYDKSTCERNFTQADAAGDLSSMNKHITGLLREMWNIYESVLGDEWRAMTYQKVDLSNHLIFVPHEVQFHFVQKPCRLS